MRRAEPPVRHPRGYAVRAITVALGFLLARPVPMFARTTAATPTAEQGAGESSSAPARGGVFSRAGYGALAVAENVAYVPAKLGYCLMGVVVGTAMYGLTFGNKQAAKGIFQQAFGGDYILTPSMVAGDEPINFSGPQPAYETPTETPTPSPTPRAPLATPVVGPGAAAGRKSLRWWHFWGRRTAAPKAAEGARATPLSPTGSPTTQIPGATPVASPVAAPTPTAISTRRAWWHFWSRGRATPKAAQSARETPTASTASTMRGTPGPTPAAGLGAAGTPTARSTSRAWWHFW